MHGFFAAQAAHTPQISLYIRPRSFSSRAKHHDRANIMIAPTSGIVEEDLDALRRVVAEGVINRPNALLSYSVYCAAFMMVSFLVATNVLCFMIRSKQLYGVVIVAFVDCAFAVLVCDYVRINSQTSVQIVVQRHMISGTLQRQHANPNQNCAICLEPLCGMVFKTECNHRFHPACIAKSYAASKHRVCPLCRGPISNVTEHII